MADMSKFSPDGGPTVFDLKDRFVRPHIEQFVRDTVGWTGKNILDYATIKNAYVANITQIMDGIRVVANSTTIYANANIILDNLKSNKGYILSCNAVVVNNGIREIKVEGSSDGTNYSTLGDVKNDSQLSITFNTQSYQYIRLRFYASGSNTASGDGCDYTNIMLCHAECTDPTYEPYHDSVEVTFEEELHGVNLLPMQGTSGTTNGITFTVNSNGSVSTNNGTASAQIQFFIGRFKVKAGETYTISSGNVDSASCRLWTLKTDWSESQAFPYGNRLGTDTEDNKTRTALVDEECLVILQIANGTSAGSKTFYPMVRKADIDDPTYRPYNPQAIQNQLNAETGVLGVKNLLENVKKRAVGSTLTHNGVTFTLNSDYSVTANGTATGGNAEFYFFSETDSDFADFYKKKLAGKTVLLSGGVAGSISTYFIGEWDNVNNVNKVDTTGAGVEITFPAYSQITACNLKIRVLIGQTVNNLTIYPMIRLASDPDDTYVPYVKTNRELTTDKAEVSAIATNENGETASKAYAVGEHFYKDGKFCTAIAAIASGETFTRNTNYVEDNLGNILRPQDITSELIVNKGTLGTGCAITKYGNLVQLFLRITGITVNSTEAIVTLPVKYCPFSRQQFMGVAKIVGGQITTALFTTTPNGLEIAITDSLTNQDITVWSTCWLVDK